jgi:diguanylate cyclase (GGDEF)-like protein
VIARDDNRTTQRTRVPRGTAPISRGACLVVIHGERLGQCIDLHDVPVVIGRAPHCDFQIEHPSVSRLHCKVWHEGNRYYVRDLGATNRTLVNERPIDETQLRDGDRLIIGDVVLKFVARGSLEASYHQALYQLATLDSLTQFYNRRKFRELLEAAVRRARETGTPLALAFIDLDHFKAINDRHGHIAGDDVLRTVADAMRATARTHELIGRLGGEEFALCMPDTTLTAAADRAEAMRRTVESVEVQLAGAAQQVTASVGVAQLVGSMANAGELMREADLQLFRAKAGGRNRVCVTGQP